MAAHRSIEHHQEGESGMGFWGAMIMSFFGTFFAIASIVQLEGARSPYLVIPVVVFAAFALYARRVHRAVSSERQVHQLTERAQKVVRWASIGEGVGILIAINVANNLGHPELKLAAVALVVGLHFLPMAYGIPFWQFYVLGVALIVTSILGMYMAQPVGNAFAALAACVGLWAAALLAMRREVRGVLVVPAHS